MFKVLLQMVFCFKLFLCSILTAGYVPNMSDDEGRYSFENQPEVGYFNLEKLMIAMSSLLFQQRYHCK